MGRRSIATPAWLRPTLVAATGSVVTPLGRALRAAARAGGRPGHILVEPRRILVVCIHYLGDSVLTLPLLDGLTERWPDARIDVWCRARAADFFGHTVGRDQVIVSDLVASDRTRETSLPFSRSGILLGQLRRTGYDLAIDASGVPGTALALMASGARCVIGSSSQGLSACYDVAVEPGRDDEHLIERRRRLSRALGLGEKAMGTPVMRRPRLGEAGEAQLGGIDDLTLLLHVGGGWAAKRWPADRWGELASLLQKGQPGDVTLVAGRGEDELLDAAVAAAGSPAVRKCSLDRFSLLSGALSRARGLVVADSGPAHVAAALSCPVLTLHGPTDPALTRPLGERVHTMRAPTGRMESLIVEEVAAATSNLSGPGS